MIRLSPTFWLWEPEILLGFFVASRCTKPPASLIIGQVSRYETHFNAEILAFTGACLHGWCTISIRHRCVFKKLVCSELWTWNPIVMTQFFCAESSCLGSRTLVLTNTLTVVFIYFLKRQIRMEPAWERFESVPLHLTFINHVLLCFANLNIWFPMIY